MADLVPGDRTQRRRQKRTRIELKGERAKILRILPGVVGGVCQYQLKVSGIDKVENGLSGRRVSVRVWRCSIVKEAAYKGKRVALAALANDRQRTNGSAP